MLNTAVTPPKLMPSISGPDLPKRRAADLSGIVSLPIKDLFGDISQEIYLDGDDLSAVRQATEETLASVDMSMIKPEDTVNLLCSEHGFSILGGEPYAQMVKTTKDVVQERTGCRKIRLVFCVGWGLTEAREMIPYYKLDSHFDRIASTFPFDKGVAIKTDIGTLYGLKRVYDADWIIHTCYTDPREVHFHREMNRILKSFTMAYARYETRSVYHQNFASRSSNIIPRAIFESQFVQDRFAFACCMETSPAGITSISADEDLHRLDRRITKKTLKDYGKLMRLFAEIDECVAILDGMRWPWYIHGGGMISGSLFRAHIDYLNLDISGRNEGDPSVNPAVKALVVNYAWRELFLGLTHSYPIIVAGRDTAKGLPKAISKYGVIAEDLESAMETAFHTAKTDKAIVFDGSYGSINLSPSMGKFLMEHAPGVSLKVDNDLLPLWLKQRGIDPKED